MRQLPGIVPLTVLPLAGCGVEREQPESPPGGTDGPVAADSPPGRTFAGTEVAEDGERREPAVGTEARIGSTPHLAHPSHAGPDGRW